jgi:E3 ubiquitin-protein ligase BAH
VRYDRPFRVILPPDVLLTGVLAFPPHWVCLAIPYSQLKKCLKKVQRELQDLGLDPDTLRQLLQANEASPLALKYNLDGTLNGQLIAICSKALTFGNEATASKILRPKLTVQVHLKDGIPIEASLTPTSRTFLRKIAAAGRAQSQTTDTGAYSNQDDFLGRPGAKSLETPALGNAGDIRSEGWIHCDRAVDSAVEPRTSLRNVLSEPHKLIEVSLVFDGEFFDILQSDVNSLDALQAEEERSMNIEIVSLGKDISQLVKPTRLSKTDLSRWRTIFELYLEAQIFFSTHERDHGARTSKVALERLQWFQGELQRSDLARNFKLRQSRQVLDRFASLNSILLKNLQFQEINKLAVTKILKSRQCTKTGIDWIEILQLTG